MYPVMLRVVSVKCHVSCVIVSCHVVMSCVYWYFLRSMLSVKKLHSCVNCHIPMLSDSLEPWRNLPIYVLLLNFVHEVSYVMSYQWWWWRVLHITYHVSCAMYHVSYIMYHIWCRCMSMMYDIWFVMYDVSCMHGSVSCWSYHHIISPYHDIIISSSLLFRFNM